MNPQSFLFFVVFPIVLVLGPVCCMAISSHSKAADAAIRTARLTAAMTFDLSQSRRRYMRESGVTREVAIAHERECRRFLGLIGVNRGIRFGLMSETVDAYWHTMLECTELYRNYCMAVAGRFIDHDPDGGGQAPYARTWAAYRETFGMEPPIDVWPRPTDEQIAAAGVSRKDASGSWAEPAVGALVPALVFASMGQKRDDGGSDSGSGASGVDCGGHGCSGGCSGGGGGGCSGGCSGGCGGE